MICGERTKPNEIEKYDENEEKKNTNQKYFLSRRRKTKLARILSNAKEKLSTIFFISSLTCEIIASSFYVSD